MVLLNLIKWRKIAANAVSCHFLLFFERCFMSDYIENTFSVINLVFGSYKPTHLKHILKLYIIEETSYLEHVIPLWTRTGERDLKIVSRCLKQR